MDPPVRRQPSLPRPAIALLQTMSRIRSREPTGGQPNQNCLINSLGADHGHVDDCLGAWSHHCHKGFCESGTFTARSATKRHESLQCPNGKYSSFVFGAVSLDQRPTRKRSANMIKLAYVHSLLVGSEYSPASGRLPHRHL